jgi:hypothetical protein
MSKDKIKKTIIKKKLKNSNKKNEDQIWKTKKQMRGWIILDWRVKLKIKIKFIK